MTKTNVKVKESLTMEERVVITNHLVDSYFTEKDDGTVIYTPYMVDSALIIAFFLYCVDGIEFDDDDKIYEIVCNDPELLDTYTTTLSTNPDDSDNPCVNLIRVIKTIMNDVTDIVGFRKQQIIHNNHILNNKILEILNMQEQLERLKLEIAENENKVLQQQIKQNSYSEEVLSYMTPEETATLNKKMLNEDMDFNKLAEIVTERYLKERKGNIVDMKSTPTKLKRKKTNSNASSHGVNE